MQNCFDTNESWPKIDSATWNVPIFKRIIHFDRMSIIRHSRAILRTSDSPNMRKSMISTSFTNDMAPGFEDLTRYRLGL